MPLPVETYDKLRANVRIKANFGGMLADSFPNSPVRTCRTRMASKGKNWWPVEGAGCSGSVVRPRILKRSSKNWI